MADFPVGDQKFGGNEPGKGGPVGGILIPGRVFLAGIDRAGKKDQVRDFIRMIHGKPRGDRAAVGMAHKQDPLARGSLIENGSKLAALLLQRPLNDSSAGASKTWTVHSDHERLLLQFRVAKIFDPSPPIAGRAVDEDNQWFCRALADFDVMDVAIGYFVVMRKIWVFGRELHGNGRSALERLADFFWHPCGTRREKKAKGQDRQEERPMFWQKRFAQIHNDVRNYPLKLDALSPGK